MPHPRTARRARARKGFVLQKPNGTLTPRVQAAEPQDRHNFPEVVVIGTP